MTRPRISQDRLKSDKSKMAEVVLARGTSSGPKKITLVNHWSIDIVNT
jgi:hypothetical protein